MGWLAQNGVYLVFFAAFVGWLYWKFGVEGIFKAGMVAVGLGFVIFIHELGHFLAAKWCDVHVQTFSIGFGPALPGCSFQRGETTYKIAILPLGGFVNMVGEGPEADENEDYPRSFKNKTVGQRMLIISAGVIMNVLLACVCFVVVYRYHGEYRLPAVVARVEPGSPAWKAGVRTGSTITRLDNLENPWFEDLRVKVALSSAGKKIPFTFRMPDGSLRDIELEPRRDANDLYPVIGVASPYLLKLPPPALKKQHDLPVADNSPAAFARAMDLGPRDVVVAASDPAHDGKVWPLPQDPEKLYLELCKRMVALGADTLVLSVLRDGAAKPETVEVPRQGFDFDDRIVGTTDPADASHPFHVKELPPNPGKGTDQTHDPFAYNRRMKELAGKPAVIQVRRGDATVNLLVPPAFHYTTGLIMAMGEIAAVRDDSPAAKAGVKAAEPGKTKVILQKVTLSWRNPFGQRIDQEFANPDPVRLPFDLARAAAARPGVPMVTLTVKRSNADNHKDDDLQTLGPVPWDASWDFSEETPVSRFSPVSIPQLGLAYWVTSTVQEVQSGSPAAKKGLRPGDKVREIRFRDRNDRRSGEEKWSNWSEMKSKRGPGLEVYDQWGHYHWLLQLTEFHEMEVKVFRDNRELDETFRLQAEPDDTWPLEERGVLFLASLEKRLQKADSLWEALTFGVNRTVGFIQQIYLNLRSLVVGRISTDTLGGPIEIASQAFTAAGEDFYFFLLFLGIISVNLAVVNFLPIPVLDGGHMVFLIYEKLRGRPPSEGVRVAATYVGLAMIFSLMIFVVWLDIKRRIL
jgi:regulator of sigma E protease